MASITNPNLIFKQLILSSLKAPKYAVRNCVCARTSIRSFSNKRLSDTSIMLHSGKDIQELPLVVKNLSSVDVGHVLFCENIKDTQNRPPLDTYSSGTIPHQQEIDEIIVGFDKCNTIPEVLKLLEILPSTYVEPAVAFQIMKKMSELDEHQTLLSERMGEEVPQNFTTAAIFNQLIGTILSGHDRSTLINCLKLINQRSTFKNYFEPFHEQLMEKIMMKVTKNIFSITELCDIAEEFHICDYVNEIDKLWIGIAENAKSIDATNIINVFHVLPYFKTSRNMIMKILLERMTDTWWYLEGKDIVELLSVLRNSQLYSHELMLILGRWLNTKIHAVDEDELLSVVKAFGDLNFVNSQIIAALERYVKIKLDLIDNPNLIAAIMDYCDRFKVRSATILENASNYFISKGASLSPAVVKSLIVPFGNLHFPPTRSFEFWKTFEQVLEDKFTRFEPEDVVDIMLSCIYLEKYPINFINYIFNPYFLTRLQVSSKNWLATKNKLTLFDHHMNVNCASYKGPLLPKEVPTSVLVVDKQLKHALIRMKSTLIAEYGREYFVHDNKILPCCPVDHRCIMNLYLQPRVHARSRPRLAILIHLIDEYTYDGETLIGLQQSRCRHFLNMGMKVISLKYSQLIGYYAKDGALRMYLRETIDPLLNE